MSGKKKDVLLTPTKYRTDASKKKKSTNKNPPPPEPKEGEEYDVYDVGLQCKLPETKDTGVQTLLIVCNRSTQTEDDSTPERAPEEAEQSEQTKKHKDGTKKGGGASRKRFADRWFGGNNRGYYNRYDYVPANNWYQNNYPSYPSYQDDYQNYQNNEYYNDNQGYNYYNNYQNF